MSLNRFLCRSNRAAAFKSIRRCTEALLLGGMLAAAMPLQARPLSAHEAGRWIATWTASPQLLWEGNFPLPTNVPFNFWNQTLRQEARVSVGGRRIRIRLSNEYGTTPLVVGAAYRARLRWCEHCRWHGSHADVRRTDVHYPCARRAGHQ